MKYKFTTACSLLMTAGWQNDRVHVKKKLFKNIKKHSYTIRMN